MRNHVLYPAGAAALLGMLVSCAPVPAPGTMPGGVVDRSAPPPPLTARSIAFPAFHEVRLPNGLELVVLEHTAQPVASVNLYVRSGGAADPAQQAGRAGLMADVLTKGTATRSATQISGSSRGWAAT
jgi:zinc protease